MIKIIKEYTKSDYVYNNITSISNKVNINIDDEIVSVDYNKIIDTQFLGGNLKKKFPNIKNLLGLSSYSKSPCGGFVNFYSLMSNKGNEYVIYSGINEISNSNYIVTIHKIIKLIQPVSSR